MSHPAWDEWIEIRLIVMVTSQVMESHPAWDEWIEIGQSMLGKKFEV